MVMRLVDETESWPICQKLAETVSSGAKHGSQIFSARKKRLFRVSDTSLLSASSKTPTAEYWQAGFRHADYFVSCAGRQRAILTGFGGLSAGNETLHKTDAFFILGYNQIVVEFFLSGHWNSTIRALHRGNRYFRQSPQSNSRRSKRTTLDSSTKRCVRSRRLCSSRLSGRPTLL